MPSVIKRMKPNSSAMKFAWTTFVLTTLALLPVSSYAAFADIDVTHPYFQSIDDLQTRGIVEGHDVGSTKMFFPLSKINRAEALKLILLSTETQAQPSGDTYADVGRNDWFTAYVETASALGIVEGFPDGSFRPANKVLRAEFVKMLFEAHEVPVPAPTATEAWYEPYLIIAAEYRLLPASQEPSQELSRGEAAEIIYRTQQVAANEFSRKFIFAGEGLASFYNEGFAGRPTASGEIYDPMALTAAHRTLPFNTRLKVSNTEGDFVIVRITDRGPYHQKRVLDLSQAAFERLAPIGTGVLPVSFEVFSDPVDEIKAIPEAIRPLLSAETRAPEVPVEIQERLRIEPETVGSGVVTVTTPIPDKSVMYDKPIFGEAISSVATDFFPDIRLRQRIDQKVPQGLVMELAGTSTHTQRFKKVTVFMQNQASGEQTHFEAPVSGTNFVVPIYFFETGVFDMGIVFDDERESRVAEIEVAPYPRERKLPASDVSFASNLVVNVVPEDEIATFRWASGENRLTKLEFSQGNEVFEVVLTGGMSYFEFPYDWFDREFDLNRPLAIDMYQALSEDGTLLAQRTNWKKVTFRNFELVRGFPDTEEPSVSVQNFQRYYRSPQTISLQGKVLDSNTELEELAFITTPDGFVSSVSLYRSGDSFSFSFDATDMGRYIVELISDQGDILFNRGVYFSDNEVLPVMANVQTVVNQNSRQAVYDWINRIRNKHQISQLLSNSDLQEVAQAYADRMAREDFIGHVAPDGSTPADRLDHLQLRSFAENVSFGSNLNLALSGLENSGSHRKNILSSRWQRMGVGVAQNREGEYYVVQLFAN
jgi:rare lipoprotein A (peptidoglycan hydrolase)